VSDLLIRAADPADTHLLLRLIGELAEAEAFPFPVTVSADDLQDSLFGPHPAAEAVIAYSAERPAGFAVFYETFATTTGRRGLHLDDLFVRPEFQGVGYGKALVTHLAGIARDRGCARFEWWALATNVPAIEFFSRLGARRMDELVIFRTQGETLEQLSFTGSEPDR
jgi:GNAT superfamily N-acetyltransferase